MLGLVQMARAGMVTDMSGCTSNVLYFDGGEILLDSFDVWVRPRTPGKPGEAPTAVLVRDHTDLAQFGDRRVDLVAVPKRPGIPAQAWPPQVDWWSKAPLGAVGGTVTHDSSRGQGHTITLTEDRRQQIRRLALHASEQVGVENEQEIRGLLKDWYRNAESRGPDRVRWYTDRLLEDQLATDPDALLDAIEDDIPTLRQRVKQRDVSARAAWSAELAALRPTSGAVPARQILTHPDSISFHAVGRILQRVDGLIGDTALTAAADTADRVFRGELDEETAVTEMVGVLRETVSATQMRRAKERIMRSLLDARYELRISDSAAVGQQRSTMNLRAMIPVGGKRVPLILVVAPTGESSVAEVRTIDHNGKPFNPRRAPVTRVAVITAFTPSTTLGFDGEGLYRERDYTAPTKDDTAEMGQKLIGEALRVIAAEEPKPW